MLEIKPDMNMSAFLWLPWPPLIAQQLVCFNGLLSIRFVFTFMDYKPIVQEIRLSSCVAFHTLQSHLICIMLNSLIPYLTSCMWCNAIYSDLALIGRRKSRKRSLDDQKKSHTRLLLVMNSKAFREGRGGIRIGYHVTGSRGDKDR